MAVPISSVHYLRFILHNQTDGVLLSRKKRTGRNASVPDVKELTDLLTMFVSRGVQKVRLVGDDPALRNDLPALVRLVSQISGVNEVAMTTRGDELEGRIDELAGNGLTSINFNMDTLSRSKFRKLTGLKVKQHAEFWNTVAAALEAEIRVKFNVVLQRGVNDEEIADFVELTRDRPIHVRFLEWNTNSETIATPNKFISTRETMACVKPPLVPQRPTILDGPAIVYAVPKHKGTIGFIPNVTEHFCSTCNRIGITDQGEIKSCIFGHGLNLIKHMRTPKGAESVATFTDRVLRRKYSLSAKLSGFSSVSSDATVQVPVMN